MNVEIDEAEFDGFVVFDVGGGPRDRARGLERSDTDLLAVPIPGEVSEPVEVLEDRMVRVDPEDSFPVFLDSERREVALPRTEETTGQGFHDFDVSLVPPGTPVREAVRIDLERRDLTVNAIAQSVSDFPGVGIEEGEIIDPFGGLDDLEAGRIDPTSEAFAEDPLRNVRLGRFTARLDGEPTDDAIRLAREVAPDMGAVPVERFTMELRKVFKQAENPSVMFETLTEVDSLRRAFPGLRGVEEFGLVDAVESKLAQFAALGVVGDAEIIAMSQALTNDEEAAVMQGEEVSQKVARVPEMEGGEVIDLVDRLDSGRGLGVEEAVEVADARFDIEVAVVVDRLESGREAIQSVSGEDIMEMLGIDESEIGDEIAGEEFGRRLREERASLV